MMHRCYSCAYGEIDKYGNRICHYNSPKCVYETIEKENKEYVRQDVYHILAITDIYSTGKKALMQAIAPKLKDKYSLKIIEEIIDEICEKTGEEE